ncbi:MAG: RCC1 domain-containing protein, partial [Planctomycetota bacterium]
WYHSLALKSDGSIVGWGYNNHGQATPPEGNDFVAIDAGSLHSLALKSDGSIVGWGSNYDVWTDVWYGQATPPEGNDFVAIAARWYHSLALKSDGSIVGWGDNYYGQTTVPDGNDFVAIAAGGRHNLALKTDGSIVGWGWNYDLWGNFWYGQAMPPEGNDFVTIAAGEFHSFAIRREPPIEAKMKLTPQALNCKSKGRWVKAHFVLPADLTVEDVDSNISGEIESLGVEADYMDAFIGEDGLVRIEMAFDRAALCERLTEGGSIEITVKGFLTNGQYYYGTETIKIK